MSHPPRWWHFSSGTDIEAMNPAGGSLMPEGLLDGLSDAEMRELFACLRQSQPITQ